MSEAKFSDHDIEYLRRAVALSVEASRRGDPPYGALLVATGSVLKEEVNTCISTQDVTAHPELKLARWVGTIHTPSVAMYTSCQPCPMCQYAIAQSGITRVVYAMSGDQRRSVLSGEALRAEEFEVVYSGPGLAIEATGPILGYYASKYPRVDPVEPDTPPGHSVEVESPENARSGDEVDQA